MTGVDHLGVRKRGHSTDYAWLTGTSAGYVRRCARQPACSSPARHVPRTGECSGRADVVDHQRVRRSLMPSNSLPAGTPSALASLATVRTPGSRSERSILATWVVLRSASCASRSWLSPRSCRSLRRFAAKISSVSGIPDDASARVPIVPDTIGTGRCMIPGLMYDWAKSDRMEASVACESTRGSDTSSGLHGPRIRLIPKMRHRALCCTIARLSSDWCCEARRH